MDKCSCGHDCHCDKEECEDCVNDVCTNCDCQQTDIPSSFTRENV